MPASKVAITLDREVLRTIDQCVAHGEYPSRSRAIQEGMKVWIARRRRARLAREAAKLDPKEEKALAEEWFKGESWPEY